MPPKPSASVKTTLLIGRARASRRPFSVLDGFIYGVYANSIIIAAALTYSLAWPWPDANIPLGILLICLTFFPVFTVYAMLTAMLPRLGGDYIWQTRGLGIFWGYILVFTPLLVGPWFYMASNVAPGSSMVAGPLLISLGELLNWRWLVDLSRVFATRIGTWWFYVFYLTLAALVMVGGMRLYAKIQRICFAIGLLALITWISMLVMNSSESFASSFDWFMLNVLHWGNGDAYNQILSMASAKGYKAVPFSQTSLRSSLLIGPVLAYTFMYIAWTGTLAGEIRGVTRLKNTMWIYLGGSLFSMIVCAGFTYLLISRVSNEFFTSSNFLWATGNTMDMPATPHYGIFLMALSKNPWMWLWVALGLNAWFLIWPTNNMVMSTRVMLAMSNDGVLPGFITTLSRRWGTPVLAILVCYLGSLLLGWLYFFTGFSALTLDMPLMTAIAFAASNLVGTLFPFLPATRAIYANSPASRYKVAGVPLITLMGVLGCAYFAVLFFLYISDDRYGTNNPLSALFILCSIAVSGVIFLCYRHSRRKKGLNVNNAVREIPVD